MILDDLAVRLQTAGLGTLGTTIFKGRLPPDAPGPAVADEIITLLPVPGLPPRRVHDIVGPAIEQPVVQVRLRGRATPGGYAALWAKALQTFLALDGVVNTTINGVWYEALFALQSPFGLPEDEWNRPTVIFNVLARRGLAP